VIPLSQQPLDYLPRPAGWRRKIYAMPSFLVLDVCDLERASRWCQEVLGLADVFTMRSHDRAPLLAHLRCVMYVGLLLSRNPMYFPERPTVLRSGGSHPRKARQQ
jgi:hypothetical protein